MERGDRHSDFWADFFTKLNGDMDTFNAFMHNKVVMFVPELTAHFKRITDDNVATMKRLSYDSNNELVAHIDLQLQGHIYELVGPASSVPDLDGFTFWSDEDGECSKAHQLKETLESYREKYAIAKYAPCTAAGL